MWALRAAVIGSVWLLAVALPVTAITEIPHF